MILNNILFISEQTLKTECSYLNQNIDNKLLTDSIKDVQIDNIRPIIGSDLFYEIQLQISANTVTSQNQTLLEYYIQPALIKYAAAKALPNIHYQARNGTISKLVGETFQPVEFNELQFIINNLLNDAESRAQRLIDFLRANESIYPLFATPTSNGADTIYPNKSNAFTTGMYIPKSKCYNNNHKGGCNHE